MAESRQKQPLVLPVHCGLLNCILYLPWGFYLSLITTPSDVSNVQSAALLQKINNTWALIIVGTPLEAAAAGLCPMTWVCAIRILQPLWKSSLKCLPIKTDSEMVKSSERAAQLIFYKIWSVTCKCTSWGRCAACAACPSAGTPAPGEPHQLFWFCSVSQLVWEEGGLLEELEGEFVGTETETNARFSHPHLSLSFAFLHSYL